MGVTAPVGFVELLVVFLRGVCLASIRALFVEFVLIFFYYKIFGGVVGCNKLF